MRMTPEDQRCIDTLMRVHGLVSRTEVVRMCLRAHLRQLPPGERVSPVDAPQTGTDG